MCWYQWCWLCGAGYTEFHFANPFGCMFLGDGRFTKKKCSGWKRYLLKFVLILALPLLLVFGIPLVLCLVFWDETQHGNCAARSVLLVPIFLGGFILGALALALLPLTICIFLFFYFHDREKWEKLHRERLRRLALRASA